MACSGRSCDSSVQSRYFSTIQPSCPAGGSASNCAIVLGREPATCMYADPSSWNRFLGARRPRSASVSAAMSKGSLVGKVTTSLACTPMTCAESSRPIDVRLVHPAADRGLGQVELTRHLGDRPVPFRQSSTANLRRNPAPGSTLAGLRPSPPADSAGSTIGLRRTTRTTPKMSVAVSPWQRHPAVTNVRPAPGRSWPIPHRT